MAKESKVVVYDCIVDDIESEDGGKAIIAHLDPQDYDFEDKNAKGVFFKVQSWDEECKHEEFKKLGIFQGNRVKLTLEIEDGTKN